MYFATSAFLAAMSVLTATAMPLEARTPCHKNAAITAPWTRGKNGTWSDNYANNTDGNIAIRISHPGEVQIFVATPANTTGFYNMATTALQMDCAANHTVYQDVFTYRGKTDAKLKIAPGDLCNATGEAYFDLVSLRLRLVDWQLQCTCQILGDGSVHCNFPSDLSDAKVRRLGHCGGV